ncbi:unnamed protein product, partial [Prorocentrum cordatum]
GLHRDSRKIKKHALAVTRLAELQESAADRISFLRRPAGDEPFPSFELLAHRAPIWNTFLQYGSIGKAFEAVVSVKIADALQRSSPGPWFRIPCLHMMGALANSIPTAKVDPQALLQRVDDLASGIESLRSDGAIISKVAENATGTTCSSSSCPTGSAAGAFSMMSTGSLKAPFAPSTWNANRHPGAACRSTPPEEFCVSASPAADCSRWGSPIWEG